VIPAWAFDWFDYGADKPFTRNAMCSAKRGMINRANARAEKNVNPV
jgi:hypothetical protein